MKFLPFLSDPREVPRTGDSSPASSLMRYVWRMSGWHQVAVCAIAVVVTLVNLAPIELQRRIVNEVVETQNVPLLIRFGMIYIVLIVLHQLTKFCLRMYQGWLTESAIIYTRSHLLQVYGNTAEVAAPDSTEDAKEAPDESGRAVAILGAEVEKLGGFVGEALSQAFANGAMLIGVCAYMFVVEPAIAAFALAVMVPQMVLVPVIQKHLNRMTEERVTLMRDMGDRISEFDGDGRDHCLSVLPKIFDNKMRFNLLKFAMKSTLNLLNAAGPAIVLLYGGYLVMMGETQVGVIVAFISGFERLSQPVRELIGFYRIAAQTGVQHDMIAKWMSNR